MGRTTTAFTLVEILIVVVLLAIIAAVVVPQFTTASETARESMLADDLRVFRSQIEVFRAQHIGFCPGYPGGDTTATPTEKAFIAQMTKPSNAAGAVNDVRTDSFCYGPYLREIPLNPINQKRTVEILADDAAFPESADGSHGWVFQPSTNMLCSDANGADDDGRDYFDY